MNIDFETPILLIIYNRPDKTKLVFDEIKKQKPRYLFVAADGPKDIISDKEKCLVTREIINRIDWDCELKTLFRDKNLGCGLAVSQAIIWFFENVEEGIVLEDDCLPHPDFFQYCRELLARYRHNDRIMFIGGSNFQDGIARGEASYYFSAYSHVWGWASWRRVWQKYSYDLADLSSDQFNKALHIYFKKSNIISYWKTIFAVVKKGKIDTWDYQLTFSIWSVDGLSIIPNVNLVSNIGFGGGAAHTGAGNSNFENLPSSQILPLQHPLDIIIDSAADDYYNKKIKAASSILYLLLLKLKFVMPRSAYNRFKEFYLRF